MHDYLRAVGFSQLRHKRDLQQILNMILAEPEKEFIASAGKGLPIAEKSRDFIQNAGITVRGEVDERGIFSFEYYFPHYNGRFTSVTEDISFEKMSEREEYNGVCDDVNLGVSLIFHMNRLADYAGSIGRNRAETACVRLSGLSISGKVLIPLERNEEQKERRRKDKENRNGMIAAAREGDQEALENLTIDDIDLYTEIARRLKKEDVLTIVDSYFMPFGIACDQYSVMGDILECEEVYNQLTGEKLYQMLIECNDIRIDLCINADDLLGEPEKGRRFRGSLWLQGSFE